MAQQPVYAESASKHFPYKVSLAVGIRTTHDVLLKVNIGDVRFPITKFLWYVFVNTKGMTALKRSGFASNVVLAWKPDQAEKPLVTMA